MKWVGARDNKKGLDERCKNLKKKMKKEKKYNKKGLDERCVNLKKMKKKKII